MLYKWVCIMTVAPPLSAGLMVMFGSLDKRLMASRWGRVRLVLVFCNLIRGCEYLLRDKKGETRRPVELLIWEIESRVVTEIKSEGGTQVLGGLNLLARLLGS